MLSLFDGGSIPHIPGPLSARSDDQPEVSYTDLAMAALDALRSEGGPFMGLAADGAGLLDIAMCNSAVNRAVTLWATVFSTRPWHLIERKTGKEVHSHPVAEMFKHGANPEETWVEFLEQFIANYVTWGRTYGEAIRTKRGEIAAVYSIPAARAELERSAAGRLVLVAKNPDGTFTTVPCTNPDGSERILRLSMPRDKGLEAQAPIVRAARALLLAKALEDEQIAFYKNGARPNLVFNIDPAKNTKEDREKLKASLRKTHVGVANSARAMILPPGVEVTPLEATYSDAQYTETRVSQLRELARFFNTPSAKLGDISKDSKGTSEQQNLDWYQDSGGPFFEKLERRAEWTLLTHDEREKFRLDINVAEFLRGSVADQTKRVVSFVGGRIMTPNEARKEFQLPPIEGGDELISASPGLDQLPGSQQDQLTQGEDNPTDRNVRSLTPGQNRSLDRRRDAAKAARTLLEEAVAKVVKAERRQVMKDARSILKTRQQANLISRLNELYGEDGEMRSLIERQTSTPFTVLFEATLDAVADEVKGFDRSNEKTRQIIADWIKIYVRDYANASLRELLSVVGADPEGIEERLEGVFDQWEASRPGKEAGQESQKGINVFSKALYILAGVATLRWVTSGPCDYCSPLEGRTFPADSDHAHPPIHQGCKCMVTQA